MGRRLVVGLGNPGPEYDRTWHNLGFKAVRELAARLKTSVKSRRDALIGRGRYAGHDVFLMLPQTYMNRSGLPVERIAREQRIDPEEILVIFDDHDLALGRMRMRPSGGDGGHRGLRSVLHELAVPNVPRLRMGIRNEEESPEVGGYKDLADRVLAPLNEREYEYYKLLARESAQAVLDWIVAGTRMAMNRNNGRFIAAPWAESKKE